MQVTQIGYLTIVHLVFYVYNDANSWASAPGTAAHITLPYQPAE